MYVSFDVKIGRTRPESIHTSEPALNIGISNEARWADAGSQMVSSYTSGSESTGRRSADRLTGARVPLTPLVVTTVIIGLTSEKDTGDLRVTLSSRRTI